MKVVLFCGGYGLRMRDGVDPAPKPLAMIGDRPVLWHVMRYYAHFGHTDFILCLGFGATAVKDYFLNYQETSSNDFVLSKGGRSIELLESDISEWRITFVNTGLDTSIGERLRRVLDHLDGEDVFLANYGDVLSDAPLDAILRQFLASGAVATLLAATPQASFHVVDVGEDGTVQRLGPVNDLPILVNGGYFVLRREIFDFLREGEDLVGDAFPRLASRGLLRAYRHRGFWAPMDTSKERAYLEKLFHQGTRPWAVWDSRRRRSSPVGPPRGHRGKATRP